MNSKAQINSVLWAASSSRSWWKARWEFSKWIFHCDLLNHHSSRGATGLFCCEPAPPNRTAKIPSGSRVQTQTRSVSSAWNSVSQLCFGWLFLILFIFPYVTPACFPPCRGWTLFGHESGWLEIEAGLPVTLGCFDFINSSHRLQLLMSRFLETSNSELQSCQ